MPKYQVWECKIVVPGDAVMPEGFDLAPRLAAVCAVEEYVPVVACFSGWGGTLSQAEAEELDPEAAQ